jgi:hypothetical protein
MVWFNKFRREIELDEPDTVVSSEPVTVEQVHAEQNWPMLVALAVFALAFAVLIALGGRWAYHHWHKSIKTVPASTKALPPPPPADLQPSKGGTGSDANLPTTGG